MDRVESRHFPLTLSATRRAVLAGAVSAAIIPRHVLGGPRFKAPSEKLDIVAIGFGGVGVHYIEGCASENIVGLCDVDHKLSAPVFEKYPKARRWKDWRRMFDGQGAFDAVIIGTPDHTHAVIASAAMQLGKHVYCAKPLTRTVAEVRHVAKLARETGVATQMSVQTCGSNDSLTTVEWIQAGAVGKVREVHVWSDRPVWPQAMAQPAAEPVPEPLDWDLWLGPSQPVPFNRVYHPFNWRGWTEFGTGALGDMACHAFHVVFEALRLGPPTSVQASTAFLMEPDFESTSWMKARKLKTPESFPAASIVTWEFPGGTRMIWYDGGLKPPRPAGLRADVKFGGSGLMFVGDRGTLLNGFTGGPVQLTGPNAQGWKAPARNLARTTENADEDSTGHYREWINAAKGGKRPRCNFEFGALLTETALLGTVAQRTGAYLEWDSANTRFTNNPSANELLASQYRDGWKLA